MMSSFREIVVAPLSGSRRKDGTKSIGEPKILAAPVYSRDYPPAKNIE
jgi:hypothetical protein